MSIYDLDMKGMRKALRKFGKTLYGQTVFFIAYLVPFLAFVALVGFVIFAFVQPSDEIFIAACVAAVVFLVSFLIGNAYYYSELRKFLK